MKAEPEKPHTQVTGTLCFVAVKGNLKDDGDLFTAGDPFIKIKVGEKE